MKKIIILALICIIVFAIYSFNNKKKNLIFSIGSATGDIIYKKENARITDIIIGIESNQKIGEHDFQHILIKATTIKINIKDFIVLNNYSGIISQLKDLEKLLILLRKYSKENIEIKLIDEDSEIVEYTNKKISILCKKYDIMVMR